MIGASLYLLVVSEGLVESNGINAGTAWSALCAAFSIGEDESHGSGMLLRSPGKLTEDRQPTQSICPI